MKTLCLVLLLFAQMAAAQTLTGDRIRLNTGPCYVRSGNGVPEGVVVGRPCDVYIRTTDGTVWAKWTGTGSVGWNVGFNTNARINGNTDVTGYIGVFGYSSQLTGWRIDNLGSGDFRRIYADELVSKKFITDLEQALAGSQIITKSVSTLGANFSNPAPGAAATIIVRDLPSAENMAVFETGDTIRLRTFSRAFGVLTIVDSFGVVSGYGDQVGGTQTWTYTRNVGANGGTMITGQVIQVDSVVLDYGVSGDGFHEINAVDGLYGINAPYAQTATWTGAPTAANTVVRSRLGNLRGITGNTGEYGIIAGTYAASGGRYFRASDRAFELQGIDLSMWDGATKTFFLDHVAPSLAIGSPAPSAYATGTGIWMGKDGGVYKFRVGNPAGNRLTWDGTSLSIVGDGGGITNINGANIQTGTITAAKINVTSLSAISANIGTITAGSISGVTGSIGGCTLSSTQLTCGSTVLDSNGVSIATGSGGSHNVKWSDGSAIFGNSGTLVHEASSDMQFNVASVYLLHWNGSGFYSTNGNASLGNGSNRWPDFFLANSLNWSNPPTTTSNDYPMVYSTGNTQIYRKTNGTDGGSICGSTGVQNISIDRGIVVGVTCF